MKDPEKIRQRVIMISGLNAWSILVVAGLFAVISLLMGDAWGTLVGVAVLVSPLMEMKGRSLFKKNRPGARPWYLRSQIWLFCVIVSYCVSQLLAFYLHGGAAALPAEVREAFYQALLLDEKGLNAFLEKIYLAIYLTIILVSLLYQGGLFLFYRRHVPADISST